MMNITKTVIASAMGICLFSAASAQDATVQPSSVVESYDDWTLACDNLEIPMAKAAEDAKDGEKKDDAEGKKTETKTLCEVHQTYTNPKTKKDVARLIFAFLEEEGKEPKLRSVLRTLVDVSFDKQPVINDEGNPIIEGKMDRCAGNYCYIEFDIDDAKLKLLENAKKPQFAYPLSNDRMISIGMSAKGLDGAIKSLKAKQEKK